MHVKRGWLFGAVINYSAEVLKALRVGIHFIHFLWLDHRHDRLLVREGLVEVLDVEHVRAQLRLEWRFDLHFQQFFVVELLQPRVLQDLADAVLRAHALLGGFLQQLRNEVLALAGHRDLVALGVGEVNRLRLD